VSRRRGGSLRVAAVSAASAAVLVTAVSLLFLQEPMITAVRALSSSPPSSIKESRFFLDTANVSEWEELFSTGIFYGITTNPTLLERADEPCTVPNLHRLARKAYELGAKEFMCQAWGSTAEELYECGVQLQQPFERDQIVIKVPVTQTGLEAATLLIRKANVRVCLTACYSHKQALLAAAVGADYLAPYLGRMTDAGKEGLEECMKMQRILVGTKRAQQTRILVASIRHVDQISELSSSLASTGGGLETFTFSPEISRDLLDDALTEEAAQAFEEAAKTNQ